MDSVVSNFSSNQTYFEWVVSVLDILHCTIRNYMMKMMMMMEYTWTQSFNVTPTIEIYFTYYSTKLLCRTAVYCQNTLDMCC